MDQNDEILNEIIDTAVTALFKDYGAPIVPDMREDPGTLSFAGIIGFTGESIRGTLMLAMSIGALERARPTGTEKPREWIGELTNQLLGRVKNQLLRYGVEAYLTTPLVIRGEHLATDTPTLRPRRYSVEGEKLSIWFDREIIPGLVLIETQDAAATEGDVFLF